MSSILDAILFAKNKHDATGKLYNGEPYFMHPLQVFTILRDLKPDDHNLLAATLLHDTLEDTDTTYEELVKNFNKDIADLVKEVTKNKNKDFPNLKTERGLLLKAADRLANIASLKETDSEKREKLLKKYSYCFIHEGSHLKNEK